MSTDDLYDAILDGDARKVGAILSGTAIGQFQASEYIRIPPLILAVDWHDVATVRAIIYSDGFSAEDMMVTDDWGRSVLHVAVRHRDISILKLLVAHRYCPRQLVGLRCSEGGYSAIGLALERGLYHMADVLVPYSSLEMLARADNSCKVNLNSPVTCRAAAIIAKFEGFTSLYADYELEIILKNSIIVGNVELTQRLLSAGVDPNRTIIGGMAAV